MKRQRASIYIDLPAEVQRLRDQRTLLVITAVMGWLVVALLILLWPIKL